MRRYVWVSDNQQVVFYVSGVLTTRSSSVLTLSLPKQKRPQIIQGMTRVAIWSPKNGGVDKSTVTALLGLSFLDIGKKLGLLDVDLFGRS